MEKLRKAMEENLLRIPEKQAKLFADPRLFKQEAYSRFWHIYIKKTFRGANQVVS